MEYTPSFFELDASGIWPGKGKAAPNPYVFSDTIAICVDVAFATNRPLLVSGPPGCGKSVLAPTLADIKEWRYLRHTFTSRTRLEDLTGSIDQVRRLSDAQAAQSGTPLPPLWSYLEPGILWWAFAPESASRRGSSVKEFASFYESRSEDFLPPRPPSTTSTAETGNAVLLLDEIDKAEPDVPNDLLEPLDERAFSVTQGPKIESPRALQTLVIITTNQERELPPAFVRRCVSLHIDAPDKGALVRIAERHYPKAGKKLRESLADTIIKQRAKARHADIRPPSTSEYLDAIEACRTLKVKPDDNDPRWQQIMNSTLIKTNTDGEEQ